MEQNERCLRCGTFHWQWGTEAEPKTPYEADGYTCGGCAALEVEEALRKDKPTIPGTRVVLFPRTPDGT